MNSEDLFQKIRSRYSQGRPFVVYRKPEDSKITAWFLNSDDVVGDFKNAHSGFVMAPFVPEAAVTIFPKSSCDIVHVEVDLKQEELKQTLHNHEGIEPDPKYLQMITDGIEAINTTLL